MQEMSPQESDQNCLTASYGIQVHFLYYHITNAILREQGGLLVPPSTK